jgi:hypothetical protein
MDPYDDLALAALDGDGQLTLSARDLERPYGPLVLAKHVIGQFAAVLIVLPYATDSEPEFDLDVCLAARSDTSQLWELRSSGGATYGGVPADLCGDEFVTLGSASITVYDDGRERLLTGFAGYSPSRSVAAKVGSRELATIDVASHGLFCYAACVDPDETVELREVGYVDTA